MKMLAYHSDKKIKAKYVFRVKAHVKADRLVQGTGWDNGKGCAVGCTLEKYDHAAYETELGIPWRVAILEDVIFEALPPAEAMLWPLRFLKAISPGADLSLVAPRFILWMLTDPKGGVIRFANNEGKEAIKKVATLWDCWINGKEPSNTAEGAAKNAAKNAAWSMACSVARGAAESAAKNAAWSAAESAAWGAAWSAARNATESAARNAAESAARNAAESAAWGAAESAARNATESAAWGAAESATMQAQANKLIELLKKCKRS